jgi:hypothetical protein
MQFNSVGTVVSGAQDGVEELTDSTEGMTLLIHLANRRALMTNDNTPGRERPRDFLMFILDVMRHDEIENVPAIVNMLNDFETIGWRDHWPEDFTSSEVVGGIRELLSLKLIRALVYDGEAGRLIDSQTPVDIEDAENVWFRITELGWQVLAQWDPPAQ